MKIDEITDILDMLFCPGLQEDYDNSGTQVIFRGTEISSVLIALDIDSRVTVEAIRNKCGLIITHHPLFFNGIKKIDTEMAQSSLIVELIEKRINVYSAHTNLDKLFYDRLAKTIGFQDIRSLYPVQDYATGQEAGFGALAYLEKPAELKEIISRVKKSLGLDFVVYSGDIVQNVNKIALLNGAGGKSIEKIVRDKIADCIITGDVGYHHAKYAADNGVVVVDAGHFGTEIIMLGFLRERLIDCLTNTHDITDINICLSEVEQNPLKIYGPANE